MVPATMGGVTALMVRRDTIHLELATLVRRISILSLILLVADLQLKWDNFLKLLTMHYKPLTRFSGLDEPTTTLKTSL